MKYTMADTEEVFDSMMEAIDYIHAEEIIYYNRAMEYLSEHDFSLRESLAMADDFGMEVKNLSSETLATIHYQDFLFKSLEEIKIDNQIQRAVKSNLEIKHNKKKKPSIIQRAFFISQINHKYP